MPSPEPRSRFQLAETGGLLSDPSRIAILYALMDGSARPAGELARMAGITPATASAHLRKLLEGGFLAVWSQGRHRYFRLAGAEVANALESLALVGTPRLAAVPERTDGQTRRARVCYDHVAGLLGVALFERICERDGWRLSADAVYLRPDGRALLADAGLTVSTDPGMALAGRACVDWTERRFHLAGPLGAWLAARLLDAGWLRRARGARTLRVTPTGRSGLARIGVRWDALSPAPRDALSGAA